MNAYSLGLYEKAMPASLTWREKLECAKDCGYDYLEISIDEQDVRLERLNWTARERQELVALMRETNLPIRTMCLSGHRKYPMGSADPAIRTRSMEILKKAIDLADDLGIRIIQLAGYDVYYEDSTKATKAAFEKNLKTATEMAAAKGVVLGFETMEVEFMNTVWKSMFYVNQMSSPFLGIYPDSGNLTNAAVANGTSVLEDLESGKGHIVALHLKETLPGKFREIPFLTGHVDFPAVIAKAWELGVRRFTTEMWDVGKPTWKEDIQFVSRSMRELLDQHVCTYAGPEKAPLREDGLE